MRFSLLDWLYPRVCPKCKQLSDRADRHLCTTCLSGVRWYDEGLCALCGQPAEGEISHDYLCDACRVNRPHFDRARAAASYESVAELVQDLKYNKATWLVPDLADFLEGALTAHFPAEAVDVVVPVPLHPKRLHKRGYNQAALLAAELASRIHRRFDVSSLARVRDTPTQTRLSAEERRKNMRDAFAVRRPDWIRSRCVLVVDDVMTTGSTLSACAQTLKAAGARTVYALAVARGAGT